MKRRPRLLLIAYYFPPANAIGGVRAYNIAKWLSRRGWEVTVVTPRGDVWRNVEDRAGVDATLAREGIRCIRTDNHWRILSPGHLALRDSPAWRVAGGIVRRASRLAGLEAEAGWMEDSAKACECLAPEDVDVILATGTPFGSFQLACNEGERLNRPFVMDYRDLWTANPHSIGRVRRGTVELEKSLLARAAAVFAVSPGMVEVLASRCPPEKPVRVVTNGFDPEELEKVEPFAFDRNAIVYAGSFYPPKRVITPVMAALQRLRSPGGSAPDWIFHYYGWDSDHVRHAAERHGVEDRVVLHGMRPRREVLSAVKGARVSVIVASVQENVRRRDRGIVTGKVFEAIGLGTPMLVVAPLESDLDGIVQTAGRGARFAGSEIDGMAQFLRDALEGRVPPSRRPDSYAWPAIVDRLDAFLRTSMAGEPAPVELPDAAAIPVEG